MEKDLKRLKDLHFRLTEDMKQTMFDMLTIQKMLDSEELTYKERKELEKEKARLLSHFRTELHTNNPVEVAIARTVLNMRDSDE